MCLGLVCLGPSASTFGEPWPAATPATTSLLLSGAAAVWAQPMEDEPDDRLSREDERLTRELTERCMPELVRELMSGHPPAHMVYVARAYAQAGAADGDASVKEKFYETAAREYRKVIALEKQADWLKGLRRRFNIVQWRVELADLILQHWIAADLDRYEITSGMDYDRARLSARLREAYDLYAVTEQALDTFLVGLRTEEERYLLLGLNDKVAALYEHRKLNAAWAALYWAMAGDADEAQRKRLLDSALNSFDVISRSTKDTTRKYVAMLGAGIALRESNRGPEAEAAFDRVGDSTASAALTARARFEKARLFIRMKRFEEARRQLDALAAMSTRHAPDEDAGQVFYVRLAPLISAYSLALEAKEGRGPPAQKEKLQKEAVSALTAISEQGGIWPEIVRVYLDAVAGTRRSLAELTPTELRVTAGRQMAEKDYREAIRTLQVLLDRGDAKELHAEARFNLAVCLFQTQDVRAAAEAFLAVARENDGGKVVEQAAEYAYRCWRQIAHESKAAGDYAQLAEAAETLARKYPGHESAEEASWVAALAREEAGDSELAAAAFAEVPPKSPHYWEARRNAARCKQRLYEALPVSASAERRGVRAQTTSAAWLRLAEDLEAAKFPKAAKDGAEPRLPGVGTRADRDRWVSDARLSAASILASDKVRAYKDGLAIVAKMPATGRVVALRIMCYRGLGDLAAAKKALEEYLGQTEDAEIGGALLGLAAEMESEVNRLRAAGATQEAARVAESSIPTIRQLLEWIQAQPRHRQHVPVVQFSLAKALGEAGHREEAMALLDRLMSDDPENGNYLRAAALLQEETGQVPATGKQGTPTSGPASSEREAASNKAEALWAKLLADPTLRERAPAEYWEARYYWLRHQLRHGHAEEVAKGIETEKAWFPDLGGPPWQGRLLELAERAKATAGQAAQPPP